LAVGLLQAPPTANVPLNRVGGVTAQLESGAEEEALGVEELEEEPSAAVFDAGQRFSLKEYEEVWGVSA
jgi:hypothetical protein